MAMNLNSGLITPLEVLQTITAKIVINIFLEIQFCHK